MDTDVLIVSRAEGVATLTLNRPDRLNALSGPMMEAAIAALRDIVLDDDVRCIVVTGAGRGFCAGGDVIGMASAGGAAPSFEQKVDRQRRIHELSGLLYRSPKVTIAAINGAAAGAGLGIALACDLRIAKAGAKFTTAFAKVGLGGDFGIHAGLVRTVGEAKALELMILSDVIVAAEAQRIGLVSRVENEDAFDEAVQDLAGHIAAGPQVSYRYMKENLRMAIRNDYQTMLDREAITHLRCSETADHGEGAKAFAERRPPQFEGR